MKKNKFFIGLFLIVIVVLFLVIKNYSNNNVKSDKKEIQEENKQEIDTKDLKNSLSLFAVGDVLIHESVYKDAYSNGAYDFSKMFTEIKPIIAEYDLKFCNQESTIGGKNLGISGYPSFNSPDEIGDNIVDLGFNLISLANNHALDKGTSAVLYSNDYWKTKDVITAGAYSSLEERDDIKIYEKNGIKYSFLAYTTVMNGTVPNNYLINMYSDERVKNDIAKIKDKVDLIIVSMHWGEEYTNTPTTSQKNIATYLSNLGVNVIIGHHPHVVQPIEYINKTLVIYSLGNLISNQLSIGLNQGIGLMVGVKISIKDGEVSFDNLYKELILAYAENSTNFKVIPFSKLDSDHLSNYKSIEEQYMKIVNGGV